VHYSSRGPRPRPDPAVRFARRAADIVATMTATTSKRADNITLDGELDL